MKKKKTGKIITICIIAVITVTLAIIPLLAENRTLSSVEKNILSGTVKNGTVSSTLSAAGTLKEQDAEELTVPESVEVTDYLVSNGQAVSKGDAVAKADRVSVMKAISDVQETLEYLTDEINAASDEKSNTAIQAAASGRVKKIYVQEGDDVQQIMNEFGALAILSLDGMMSVKITSEQKLSAGERVTVILSDGTEEAGRIKTASGNTYTITLTDDGPEYGDTVRVLTQTGETLGTGTLGINSEWKITGFTGTVSSVKITEEQKVSADKTLIELADTEYTAKYAMLLSQRREYEELMHELYLMYQDGTITAPCDGRITGIDESALIAASENSAGTVMLLAANTPDGNDEAQYTNYIGKVSSVTYGSLNLNILPDAVSVTDYAALSDMDFSEDAMTQQLSCSPPASTPVYTPGAEGWQSTDLNSISKGDTVLLAYSGDSLIWIVQISKTSDPISPKDGTGENSGSSQAPHGTWPGFASMPSDPAEDAAFEPYDLAKKTLLSVVPQQTVTLSLTIDELDIFAIALGQTASVTLDAVPGQSFTGEVTEINTVSSNEGGNSKYTATITMERTEQMLGGMNASATIRLSVKENVLTVPAAALDQDGSQTILYTAYDKDTGALLSPVTVTTGISDGNTVEILSGISEGDTYWYAYYGELSSAFSDTESHAA